MALNQRDDELMTPISDHDVAAYLTQQLDRFGLRHWSVHLTCEDTPALGQRDADGNLQTGYLDHWQACYEADLSVATGRPRAEVLATVRHEVLHLVLADLNAEMSEAAERLGYEARSLAVAGWRRAEEQAVRRLEKVIRP
jgi:hypothetical protein